VVAVFNIGGYVGVGGCCGVREMGVEVGGWVRLQEGEWGVNRGVKVRAGMGVSADILTFQMQIDCRCGGCVQRCRLSADTNGGN